jgi:hypothetical protein
MVAGFSVVVRWHLTRGGESMLFLTLQCQTDLCEVAFLPDAYPGAWSVLDASCPLVARGLREIADHGGVIVGGNEALRAPCVP